MSTKKVDRSTNGSTEEEIMAPAITAEFLTSEIERLETNRAEYVTNSRRQIAIFDGAILFAYRMLDGLKATTEGVAEGGNDDI